MAAGSVMNDPSSGPTIKIEATRRRRAGPRRGRGGPSASSKIGRVDAIAMITTTNSGSV